MKQLIPEYTDVSARGASCYLCNGPKGPGGVVSTGVAIHMEGTLEICTNCVAEMAGLIGWSSPAKVALIHQDHSDELDEAKKERRGRISKAKSEEATELLDRLCELLA